MKSIRVDSQVMLFIRERYRADFTQVQQDHGVKITWEEGASSITVMPLGKASADRNDFDEACEVIASFEQAFKTATSHVPPEAWKAVVDNFMKNASTMEEKVKVQCVDQQHVISLTGKNRDVDGLVKDLEDLKTSIARKVKLEASKVTQSIDISNTEKLQFLRDVDFGKELEAEFEETQVTIIMETRKVEIRAPSDTVPRISAAVWKAMANMKELKIEMSQNAVEMLRSTAGQRFMNNQFTANNLRAALAFDSERKDNIIVMGMKIEVAEEAAKLVKRLVVEECLDLDEDQAQLEKSEKWRHLRNDLTEKRILSFFFDRSKRKIWLVGVKDDVSFALVAVKRFLKENTIVSSVVSLPRGCRRFLTRYRERELRQIEEELKEYSTLIKRVASENDEDLVVSGTTDGVQRGTTLIHKLASKVVIQKVLVNKPGMRKVLDRSQGKKLLSLLENENKCIIEQSVPPKDDLSKNALNVEEKNEKKKESIRSFLTPEGKYIRLFQDNICNRNVDVIVNAASSKLHHAAGVSKSIAEAAGEVMKDECERYIIDRGPILEGQVAITSAGKLPFKKVIHAVGPFWRKEASREKALGKSPREEKLLHYTVKTALDAAKSYQSVAIPAIGTGSHECPLALCAQIMVESALKFFQENAGCRLSEIQFTSIHDDVVKAFVKEMDSRFHQDPNYSTSPDAKEKIKAKKGKGRHKSKRRPDLESPSADIPNVIKSAEGLILTLVTGDMTKQEASHNVSFSIFIVFSFYITLKL